MLAEAGFIEIEINLKASRRNYLSPEEVFAFNEASPFGNFLMHVPESLRPRARLDLAVELEKHRTPAGIEMATNTMYAIATKPA